MWWQRGKKTPSLSLLGTKLQLSACNPVTTLTKLSTVNPKKMQKTKKD
jgi:hypothetical protein